MNKRHDWEIIASHEPFFGVLTASEYRTSNLDDPARARFYASGVADVGQVRDWLEQDTGERPLGGRALDVGCGVGRLACAMAEFADEVVGYDVSSSMLELAAKVAPDNLKLTTEFPDGPFDWINSYIVFQHIPPIEGMKLLEQCLAASTDKAVISIQITCSRDGNRPTQNPAKKIAQWGRRRLNRQLGRSVDQLIQMYDYDLGEVVRLISNRGFARISIRPTQHGIHHGVWILARRG